MTPLSAISVWPCQWSQPAICLAICKRQGFLRRPLGTPESFLCLKEASPFCNNLSDKILLHFHASAHASATCLNAASNTLS